MTTDLVVVVPGVMGSTLIDADGKEVWGLRAGTLLKALAALGKSINSLALPPDIGNGPAPDGVRPGSLIPAMHVIPGLWTPIEGYSRLQTFLLQSRFGLVEDGPGSPGNLIFFPYDWRLSNRHTATLLKTKVEETLDRWRGTSPERAQAKVVYVCHSMGGLVARWYLDRLEGWKTARSLITLGTPHRGAVKSLTHLVNGIGKGIGPLKVSLTDFARSLPSAHQLLPEYACVDSNSGTLQKVTELDLPMLDANLVRDGMAFYEELDASEARYPLMPVVGIGQPTPTTAAFVDDRLESRNTIDGKDRAGDGTVPRFSARPKRLQERDPTIRGAAEGHGLLASRRAVLDQIDFALTAEDVTYKAVGPPAGSSEGVLGVSVADLHAAGEAVAVQIHSGEPRLLQVAAIGEGGVERDVELVRFGSELDSSGRSVGSAEFADLPQGAYSMIARVPDDPGGLELTPVGSTTLVL